MPLYALVHLEDPRTDTVFKPGAVVPDDLPGIDDLIANGAIGDSPREQTVTVNDDGQVIRRIDEAGVVNRTAHIKRYDGDFTPEEIKDPSVDTPLAGVHQPVRTVIEPIVEVHDEAEGQG